MIYPVPHNPIWSPEHDPVTLTATLANARGTPRADAQIHAVIQDNLDDALLTPDVIVAAHHIPLRDMHKLFHQEAHRHRPGIGLELVDMQSAPKGLTIQTDRTTGRPQYETATT